MKTRPRTIDDDRLRAALSDGWGLDPVEIAYTPLGFGSHHWTVTDTGGERRFVTVDELDGPSQAPTAAFAELAGAFDTARALKESGLEFVVGPLRALDGATVRHLGSTFSIALFPYLDGRAGSWGDDLDHGARVALVERLAALHDATDRVRSSAPRRSIEPVTRAMEVVERALAATGRTWTGGPFAEPARQWLLERHSGVRELVSYAAQLVDQVGSRRDPLVITHGEPHPGNVIATDHGLVLIDWDTVGLAPPERDLWMFADDEQLLVHYTRITGRAVNPSALALYDVAWTLSDLSVYLEQLRSAHDANDDTSHAWQVLTNMTWRVHGSAEP